MILVFSRLYDLLVPWLFYFILVFFFWFLFVETWFLVMIDMVQVHSLLSIHASSFSWAILAFFGSRENNGRYGSCIWIHGGRVLIPSACLLNDEPRIMVLARGKSTHVLCSTREIKILVLCARQVEWYCMVVSWIDCLGGEAHGGYVL